MSDLIELADLKQIQPYVRCEDWRSPLIHRFLASENYQDASCSVEDSYKPEGAPSPTIGTFHLRWSGLQRDYDLVLRTYQRQVLTEMAALALAAITVRYRARLLITDITQRPERADYWLGERPGDRRFLLEVCGRQGGSIDADTAAKVEQLSLNPFKKDGYVCIAHFDKKRVRLWFA